MSIVYFRFAAQLPFRPVRAPTLERLIARADARTPSQSWRHEAYRLLSPPGGEPPSIGPAQLRASGDEQRHGQAFLATPLHLIAGMRDVRLPFDGILRLPPAEALRLAADFNRTFAGAGVRLAPGLAGNLICVRDSPLEVRTVAPEQALGGDIFEHQPRGADAAVLRRLSSEIEMWLFGHAVNRERGTRGEPVVSALWLWGEGEAGEQPPDIDAWAAGSDALFSTLDLEPGYPRAGAARSGVVVLSEWPGSPGWPDAERSWLEPALADLREGRVERLQICARSTSYALSARGLRRFWRRARPWWESFDLEVERDGIGEN